MLGYQSYFAFICENFWILKFLQDFWLWTALMQNLRKQFTNAAQKFPIVSIRLEVLVFLKQLGSYFDYKYICSVTSRTWTISCFYWKYVFSVIQENSLFHFQILLVFRLCVQTILFVLWGLQMMISGPKIIPTVPELYDQLFLHYFTPLYS